MVGVVDGVFVCELQKSQHVVCVCEYKTKQYQTNKSQNATNKTRNNTQDVRHCLDICLVCYSSCNAVCRELLG